MEIYAKGQLSFLILTCLLERDYYGLEIIDEVKKRSDGRICLKKPSVYSNLTRMEKQKQVSSYIQNSDLGPNRKYYSITEKGRSTYISLKEYFDRNHIDAFKEFLDDSSPASLAEPQENIVQTQTPAAFEQNENVEDEKIEEQKAEQDDFFDFSSLSEDKTVHDDGKFLTDEDVAMYKNNEVKTEIYEEDKQVVEEEQVQTMNTVLQESQADDENEISFEQEIKEDVKETQPPTTEETTSNYSLASILRSENSSVEENAQEHATIEEKTEEEQNITEEKQLSNQEIYDISKDFNKYKRKRSFADDQMAFAVQEQEENDYENKAKQNIEELKSALLENKNKYASERMSEEEFKSKTRYFNQNTQISQPTTENKPQPAYISSKPQQQDDDGVFITGTVDREQAAKARKIEPPRLKIIGEKDPLPAPKKDKSIDISHKEIISQLYAKSKGGESGAYTNPDDAIYDYEDLQDYYKSQGISFRVYEKTGYKEKHNTNKLNFYTSLICMICSILGSALLFTIIYLTKHTMPATNFLYIALPMISIAETIYRYYCYKNHTSWEPKPMLAQWIVWIITILGLGAVIALNFVFGATGKTLIDFSNTIFYPMLLILIYLPMYYYLKKALYVKYWK